MIVSLTAAKFRSLILLYAASSIPMFQMAGWGPDWSGAHPVSYPVGTRGPFPGGKMAGA